MPRHKLMIVRFPYGGKEDSECVDWLMQTYHKAANDPRLEVLNLRVNDTPVTMTRNWAFEQAIKHGVDYLLLVDSDMSPDAERFDDPAAKPFFDTTLEFMLGQEKPCVVAAPYCGPPPHENVYVFCWGNLRTGNPDADVRIDQFSREHAAQMTGITEVAALPTGLMMIDMRVFKVLTPPFTYYEYEGDGPQCDVCGTPKPGPQSKKASTEDVTFTRDLALAGVPQFCNWDAWAGHIKRHVVRKPRPYTTDSVAAKMQRAIMSRTNARDRMVAVEPGKKSRFAAEVAAALAADAAAAGMARGGETFNVEAADVAIEKHPLPQMPTAATIAPPVTTMEGYRAHIDAIARGAYGHPMQPSDLLPFDPTSGLAAG